MDGGRQLYYNFHSFRLFYFEDETTFICNKLNIISSPRSSSTKIFLTFPYHPPLSFFLSYDHPMLASMTPILIYVLLLFSFHPSPNTFHSYFISNSPSSYFCSSLHLLSSFQIFWQSFLCYNVIKCTVSRFPYCLLSIYYLHFFISFLQFLIIYISCFSSPSISKKFSSFFFPSS